MPAASILLIDTGTGPRRVHLAEYMTADGEESAAVLANEWIKALRHARVEGVTLRERFTYRGDSLWWFAELYLHKERAVLAAFRTILATEALIERERPLLIKLTRGGRVARLVVPQVCEARRVRYQGTRGFGSRASRALRLAAMDARSTALAAAAMASRHRGGAGADGREPIQVAAFVHTAFWRSEGGDGSAESYIGPVLRELERRVTPAAVRYVGIGPSTNFRVRRWWRPNVRPSRAIVPIERFAPRRALAGSWELWKSRHPIRRALCAGDDLRRAAFIRGCDCWPVVREALAGIALLQYPWSARAMDEAAAALDALRPGVAVTYAEAGGWGRALALEARRRDIPLVGLQHGFIYRHWLNYLHEADEMQPASAGSTDRGFPRPAVTLVFDEYAARHLAEAGRYPRESLAVTGSPRLEGLIAATAALDADAIAAARANAGAVAARPLVLVVSKFTEIRAWLPALVEAARQMPDVQLAIKAHPAETPALYEAAIAGTTNIRVLPAAADLAALLRASRAVLTVNSTVALDAVVLDVPSLVIGLPNNLSPFVASGVMAGSLPHEEIAPALRKVLYDEGFRQLLSSAGRAFAAEYRLAPAGAAGRSAEAIVGLIRQA